MEYLPVAANHAVTSVTAAKEKVCDCSCRRGIPCARKRAAQPAIAALEKDVTPGVIMHIAPQPLSESSP